MWRCEQLPAGNDVSFQLRCAENKVMWEENRYKFSPCPIISFIYLLFIFFFSRIANVGLFGR